MEYQLIAPHDLKNSMVEQVLLNRGIKNIDHYLHTTDSDILDPLLLDNIEAGAKMLVSHIAQGSKVMVQIDSDCDGYTSAAALMNYLNKLYPSFVQNNIFYRVHTGKVHGLILEIIPNDVKLVIAPDSSSEDYEVHKALKDKGIDVLVLDHHEAKGISDYACVINNQLCNYPNKYISGVGVVYKFCSYLDRLAETNYAKDILDLVALGCIADMMDLREYETKHLITTGLNNIQNPFLQSIIAKNEYSLGGEITPFGIGFYIAPFINAVTRAGTTEEKITLFEAMLDYRAYELIPSTKRGAHGETETRVEQACRNCVNIKNRQTRTRDASLETIEQIIKDQELLNDKVLAIRLSEAQKTNLSGLIANQLMTIYQRPVLILSPTIHEIYNEEGKLVNTETWWEGSCRGPNVPGLEDCKEFYEASRLVEYCQGHQNAFGIGIKDSNYEDFINYCNTQLATFDFTPKYKVDFIINAKDINTYRADFYALMEYNDLWGQEVSDPLIALENVVITKESIDLMKGTTLKITLSGDPDISIIKFRSSEEEYENLYSETGCVAINLVGHCKKNSWNGKPQIILKDYEVSRRAAFYF